MDTAVDISFKGCTLLFRRYRASLLKNKVKKWQDRIEAALNDVLAVQGFLTEDEVQTVCKEANTILDFLKRLQVLASDQSTWFYAREQSKELDKDSRQVQVFARTMSSAAKVRMLEGKPNRLDKKTSLDADKPPKNVDRASAVNSFELLKSLRDAYVDPESLRVDMPTQISELSKECGMGEVVECEASRQFIAAVQAAEASTSEAANSNEKLRVEFEIKAVVRMSRAMQAGVHCSCPHSHCNQGRECAQIEN
ncbi:hypothetical protein BDN72DRAFT_81194 [Pluteus cervinus]|uniref:Uncharacterized protein n=1 Tax=Pluteus cervinus TaxID=181527 RepID=A0ACD3B9R8_9AGAR|nr:hypothetical protein BDN72DRAFT_81194 [Pluteus cervinus]